MKQKSGLIYGVTERAYPASGLFYQGISYRHWVSMGQMHSARCKVVTSEMLEGGMHVIVPETDAIVTDQKGVLLSVRTADCLPILMAHSSGVTGAVHAGRKGTEGGIIGETLRVIWEQFGVADDLWFWFGPAICVGCYQIDQERDLYFDLVAENRKQISAVLGENAYKILESGLCTAEEVDRFYSYRREGDLAGRLQSYIMMDS